MKSSLDKARAAWKKGCAEGHIMPVLLALRECADALELSLVTITKLHEEREAHRSLMSELAAEIRDLEAIIEEIDEQGIQRRQGVLQLYRRAQELEGRGGSAAPSLRARAPRPGAAAAAPERGRKTMITMTPQKQEDRDIDVTVTLTFKESELIAFCNECRLALTLGQRFKEAIEDGEETEPYDALRALDA